MSIVVSIDVAVHDRRTTRTYKLDALKLPRWSTGLKHAGTTFLWRLDRIDLTSVSLDSHRLRLKDCEMWPGVKTQSRDSKQPYPIHVAHTNTRLIRGSHTRKASNAAPSLLKLNPIDLEYFRAIKLAPSIDALYVLGVLISLYPSWFFTQTSAGALVNLRVTGWMKSIRALLTRAFLDDEAANLEAWTNGLNLAPQYSAYICNDLDRLYSLLGLHPSRKRRPFFLPLSPATTNPCHLEIKLQILSSWRQQYCTISSTSSKGNTQSVWLLDATFHWVSATLFVGYCATCKADYYPRQDNSH
ncbi:hypothetical protein C8F04DRAFT_1298617 [Mycena alexandri]|uniref:Uncharacterized protein n=1 Tax=Mycena alexandri TaxID=1745969 RepID=A0AAD6SFS4_9AGAR|nr:hypothetical protein C8F04DRAFT_1298617 [Mycena alexandri]